jgi:transcriptional regulator with XRE-family HTH domain
LSFFVLQLRSDFNAVSKMWADKIVDFLNRLRSIFAMPKKPRFNHPLRKVRKAIGLSQAGFARLIQCSTPTIHAVENGRLRISPALETRIHVETGANTQELIKGRKGKALDQDGQPYSSDFYQRWKTKKEGYDKSSALKDFEALLEDALRLGKLPEVLDDAQGWFFDINEFLRKTKKLEPQ